MTEGYSVRIYIYYAACTLPKDCSVLLQCLLFLILSCRHYPNTKFTAVADTPENKRLKQQSKNQS